MTPEERFFIKMENLMATLMEAQSRHDAEIDKHSNAIRDLIILSRTFLESQKEHTVQIRENARETEKLRQIQKDTEEKLHALIDTVDRIIRNRGDKA